ncbi:MAG: mismatch repair protein MutS, partial [Bacteroidota bacterium]
TFMVDDWVYQYDTARDLMLRHFETTSLKGFGIEELTLAITAAGATLHYLKTTEHNQLQHINAVQRIAEDKYVWLDRFTIRNLELLDSPFHDGVPLIKVIDKTQSPMGARMLRRWLLLPLKDAKPIEERLSVVDYFLRSPLSVVEGQGVRFSISTQLQSLGDLERLISKVPMARVTPREVVQLKKSLQCIETIKNICAASNQTTLQKWADQLNPCLHIRNRIEKEIQPEPPALANRGGIIASGVHTELDELREISSSSKDYLLKIQQKAAEETGITTLKISFNNVFGYYLEVTNSHKNKVPASWIRKQTLTNAERYITEELKVFEEKILGAEEKINAIEQKLFEQIVKDLAEYVQPIQVNANVLAQIDCLISFATIASENNYTKPHLTDDGTLQIKDGRHPVIEKQLPVGESYVPNDIFLDRDTQQIIIITGPNMAGKSALLRQTALIVLMAQSGSFVPASHATISLVDKIFTRVGASDNISSGESTFMVEMNETASILNNISNDSLVLLDEIGRGTSTYDGISIAWSIAEYLHNHPLHKPKTLFATHYHELTELAEVYTKIKNFNVSVHEHEGKIIFLRKLKQGGSQHSFGIQVAKMAGMPANLIQRANEMMHKLEEKSLREQNRQQLRSAPAQQMQLNIFDPMSDEMKDIIQQLKLLDINKTSPVEALMKLIELKGMVR